MSAHLIVERVQEQIFREEKMAHAKCRLWLPQDWVVEFHPRDYLDFMMAVTRMIPYDYERKEFTYMGVPLRQSMARHPGEPVLYYERTVRFRT